MDHKVISGVLVIILPLLLTTVYAGGNICYVCDNVLHPADCNTIAQCAPHEVCSVTKLKTHIGIIYYRTSCQDKQLCPPANGRKKRQDAVYCTECCEQDFCNKNQCDTSPPNVIEKRCLHCDDVEHPSDCKTVIRCGKDSCAQGKCKEGTIAWRNGVYNYSQGLFTYVKKMCYVEKNIKLGYSAPRYTLGCKSKTFCNTLLSLSGRDLSKRSSTCQQCCDTENCNGKLCAGQNPSTQSRTCSDQLTDCTVLQQKTQVCSTPSTAALCKQTCGLCPVPTPTVGTNSGTSGTSSGTCSDQLSDCSTLQKQTNVCSQAQTAALCQQTCGLCSGTCKDQLSDCSVLKQRVNVCADKTAAALCQQTCGLCGTSTPPVHGGWSQWSTWGHCSKSCGSGTQTKTRSCTHPAPQYGGAQCSGASSDSQSCLVKHCPVTGGWSSWGSWGHCSQSCGSGTQTKTRSCTHPAPQYGGAQCSGATSDSQSCIVKHCPVAGGWSSWGSWGHCSKSCGSGTQTKTRSCTHPAPQYGGTQCPGASSDSQSCLVKHCPVAGGWSSWGSWGHCSQSCGSGIQTKTRSCTHPAPQYGGAQCSGASSDSQSCLVQHCPVAGGWSSWGSLGHCSKSCGSGTQTKIRSCTNPAPQYGGAQCSGASSDSQPCLLKACPLPPVDGGFTTWSTWGACSKTCDTGAQRRARTCTNPTPQHGGKPCSGDTAQTKACLVKHCPVDGYWGGWTSWGWCSVSCGDGTQSRSRICDHPLPANGGKDCTGSYFEEQSCNPTQCPALVVDGHWGGWTSWGWCSVSCGDGTQSRSRICDHPLPANGGKDCTGSYFEEQSCNPTQCPALVVNGAWSSWISTGQCSKSCGRGVMPRQRTCTNPTPSGGGAQCAGYAFEHVTCNTVACPVPIQNPWNQVPAAAGCDSGWTEYSGLCYIIIKERKTWNSALSHCHSLSGTLAEGTTQSVNNFLRNMMTSDHAACKYCWLGGQKSHGHWRWITSGSFHYTDWNTHEPDNRYGDEYCLEMGYHVDNHWNDQECSDTRNFICQKRKP